MRRQKGKPMQVFRKAYNKVTGPEPSFIRGIYDVITVYLNRGISRSSAALSYYLFFTFFPLLILFNAILSLLKVTPDILLTAIQRYVPTDIADLLSNYFTYITQNNSIALVVASVAVILTSASAAFRTIMRSNNEIFRDSSLSSFVRMAISVIMPLLLILVIYLSMVLLLTGTWFIHFLERLLNISLHLDHWGWMRFLVLFALLYFFLAALYLLTRPRQRPRPPVLLGAFWASVVLVVTSIIFSFFISTSSRYSIVYGSLASLMILLLWLYLISNVIFLGNILNYVVYCHRKAKATGSRLGTL